MWQEGWAGKISCDTSSRAGSEGEDGAHHNIFIATPQPQAEAALPVTDSAAGPPCARGQSN